MLNGTNERSNTNTIIVFIPLEVVTVCIVVCTRTFSCETDISTEQLNKNASRKLLNVATQLKPIENTAYRGIPSVCAT